MTLEAAFLRRIETEPENPLHLLLYADWLEEQGDPRGELLRIQKRLHQIDIPARPQVEQRMHQLIAQGVQPLTMTRTNSIGMKLVQIFPGEFLMGSPPEELERGDDEDQVPVSALRFGNWPQLKSFHVGFRVALVQGAFVYGENP